MSDEFEPNPENNYSTFWPLLILISGLFVWFAIQDYELNLQRRFYDQQVTGAASTIDAAQGWQGRFASILKDLNDTSTKGDTNATPILQAAVQAALQANLIHVQPGTNTNTTPAPPAATK
jgi:hypothetical protein